MVTVKRTYLQMKRPDDLEPSLTEDASARIMRLRRCPASFYRYLYSEVGRRHHWVDRLAWSDAQIDAHLAQPTISLWVLYYDGAPAGYCELAAHADESVEIAYFGLLPEFIGRGLGKHFLTVMVQEAWAAGANRVWLHTSSLDAAAAMPNYRRRGFVPFKEETYLTTMPIEPSAGA
jgi:GNAT superfamily N-acetyltransferase